LNPDLVRELGLEERWKRFEEPKEIPGPTDRPDAYRVLTDPGWARIFESYDAGVTGIPVDVRHPLFDLRLVNYCTAIPPIPWCVDKTLARVAMQNRLPDAIRLRPKSFAADAVAARLAASPWIDQWSAAAELSRFVDRSRIPILAEAGAGWDPHHRPFELNQWLSQLTPNRG
jgi:asparagine synthase (glutamine-hydrolysing)